MTIRPLPLACLVGSLAIWAYPVAFQMPNPRSQPSEIELSISGDSGTPPRFAVPIFVAASPHTADMAKVLSQTLWEDLAFEHEFYLIPRDTYASIPPVQNARQLPFAAWRELGADGVVFGSVEQVGDTLRVEVRLFNTRTRQSVFSKEYVGPSRNPRRLAHTAADEIHQQQRALRGVARTRLAFTSDRNREKVAGSTENRDVKEVFVADYDGANATRITVDRQLNIAPAWSPDGRAIAYTSYRRGFPDIFIVRPFEGTGSNPTDGKGSNFLPAYSPDGKRLTFMSSRDGNPEIYIININGSGLHRLTHHPASDVSPTWSPLGTEIAFTSDRAGTPQIYLKNVEGTGRTRRITVDESYADRPTWSPPPFNEIAFAARTGPGFDIKIYDVASKLTRQITFGEGSNESPSFAPNGRHLAFTSTRSGKVQVFTIARDGKGARQITRDGNNYTPNWSH
jgi:TolB protein